jgi:uridine kinase
MSLDQFTGRRQLRELTHRARCAMRMPHDGRVERAALVDHLAKLIGSLRVANVVRVAVDGPDAAGKTTLADELAAHLAPVREVIRASIDGFHRPREFRRRRGSLSPQGYYHDSFDYDAVSHMVLQPLGPGGNGGYRVASYDHRTESAVNAPFERATPGAVLLFDGVFLLRPELREHWDLSIYLDVDPHEAVRRALVRDADLMGGTREVLLRYQHRYLPGQRLYRQEAQPQQTADVVVNNDDPARPRLMKGYPRPGPDGGLRRQRA